MGLGVKLGILSLSGATTSVTPILDDHPNALAAFSLRKLRTAYTGDAIQVRNASNIDADIGFDSDGNLDTGTLLGHTGIGGSDYGYIQTWYDQSGGGNDLTQTADANQPIIVNAGSVNTTNGKSSISMDGAVGTQLNMVGSSVFKANTDEVNHYSVQNINNSDALSLFAQGGSHGSVYYMVWEDSATSTATSANCGTIIYYKNGSSVGTTGTITRGTLFTQFATSTQTLATLTDLDMQYFTDAAGQQFELSGYPSYEFIGDIQELIFWRGSDLPTQADAESNINSYYSIY